MNTKHDIIELGDLSINVTRKNIKNVHLSVHPPQGRVTISAPLRMELENIRLFSISKLGWVRKNQIKIKNQKREAPREYINRESHYYLGQRYLLRVAERSATPKVVLGHGIIELYVKPNATKEQKEKLLQAWYRKQLAGLISPYIDKLEKEMNVKIAGVSFRMMKTRWGTCNIKTRKILLNTELAKKPIENIEYVLIHEMTHLLERKHNKMFKAYLDKFIPQWKYLKEELNRSVLGYVEWGY